MENKITINPRPAKIRILNCLMQIGPFVCTCFLCSYYGLFTFGEFFKLLFSLYTIPVIILNVLAIYLPNRIVYPKLEAFDGSDASTDECNAIANKYSSINIGLTIGLIAL